MRIKFQTNEHTSLVFSFGYEIKGLSSSMYWFTIEKLYYENHEIVYAKLPFAAFKHYKFWNK